MNTQFEHVAIPKKADVFFGGKCISHNLFFPGGSRKTIGVLLPATVTFSAEEPEVMEIVEGMCRVRLERDGEWKTYAGGQRFFVPGACSFEIEALEPVHYVCHLGRE
jgi:purine/pyrimidine-nucleoside phosphorylase